MKKILLLSLFLTSCKNKPDFYKNGIGYEIKETCIESHTELHNTIEYDLALKMNVAKIYLEDVCDKYRIDTLVCDTL